MKSSITRDIKSSFPIGPLKPFSKLSIVLSSGRVVIASRIKRLFLKGVTTNRLRVIRIIKKEIIGRAFDPFTSPTESFFFSELEAKAKTTNMSI